jgi:beta-fructofuranosidase
MVARRRSEASHVREKGPTPLSDTNRASSPGEVTAGEFQKIYDPSVGEKEEWYINDHCILRGNDGFWHLFGITHEEPANPLEEKNLAHAVAGNLLQNPWEKRPFALSVEWDRWRESHLWAPHVIFEDGLYYMYYCAGDPDHTQYKIHLATSPDLETWTRHPANPMVVDGFDARDPMLLRAGDEWVMYYTANEKPEGGRHLVAYVKSRDLATWGEKGVAFTDPSAGTYGGPCESPFVVRRGPYYYLFIGPREDYDGTDVFRSEDPFRWELSQKVGHFPSHAAEVMRDTDGKYYVSRCGWGRGGVYLAPLEWNDGQDEADSSLPIPGA